MNKREVGDDTIAISTQQWIHVALEELPTNEYTKSAVTLSWMITKHLINLGTSTLQTLKEEDISAENVTVYIDQATSTIRHVKLYQGSASLLSFLRRNETNVVMTQRSACVCLGRILLEIFSKGQSKSQLNNSTNGTSNQSTKAATVMEKNRPLQREWQRWLFLIRYLVGQGTFY